MLFKEFQWESLHVNCLKLVLQKFYSIYTVVQKEGSKIDNLCTQFGIKPHTLISPMLIKLLMSLRLYPNQYFHVNESGKRVGNDLNGSQAENRLNMLKQLLNFITRRTE